MVTPLFIEINMYGYKQFHILINLNEPLCHHSLYFV